MLKYVVFIAMVIVHVSQAQRSFYAGNSRFPTLLGRYKTTTTTTTESPDSLVNRINENTVSGLPEFTSPLPDEYQSEYDRFLHRVSQWPEERQPFWYKNRQAISNMINQRVDGGSVQAGSASSAAGNARSPFAGRRG